MNHERKPQRQDDLASQLRDLIPVAEREGCYDAADFLRRAIENPPSCIPWPRKPGSKSRNLGYGATPNEFVLAIKGILEKAGRPMPLDEIVVELEATGLPFPPSTTNARKQLYNIMHNRYTEFCRVGHGLWTLGRLRRDK
jgi:hypothetical protein